MKWPLLLLLACAPAWAYPPTLLADVPAPSAVKCLYENVTAGHVDQFPVSIDTARGKAEYGYRMCLRSVLDWPAGQNHIRMAVRDAQGQTSAYDEKTLTRPSGAVSGARLVRDAVVSPPPPSGSEVMFFGTTAPTLQDSADTASVNLGLRFTSSVPGKVLGVRFYKQAGNGGAHIGALWSATGTRLAQATFTGETASGWQEVRFAQPAAVVAGQEFTVSYLAPQGRYAYAAGATWPLVAAPLSAAAGTYTYGAALVFPSATWQASHYWVDVIFRAD